MESHEDLSSYISKCFNKIANLTKQINDDCVRPDTKANLQYWVNYWEDEYWLAVEEKNRQDEQRMIAEGLEYSHRN